MQRTMYLKALVEKKWALNSIARVTQPQRIVLWEEYRPMGKDKDRYFDAHRWANEVQAERSAYEKIYELTSGPKDTKKSVLMTFQFDFYNKWEGLNIRRIYISLNS